MKYVQVFQACPNCSVTFSLLWVQINTTFINKKFKLMNKFVLFFRMDITTSEAQPSAEQMEIYMTQWNKWINKIATRKKLAEGGTHLSSEGKVLRKNNFISDGPYEVNKESVAGYIIIKAKTMYEAVEIARECPILQGEGTSVEVREMAAA
jgi:hypothetical protein